MRRCVLRLVACGAVGRLVFVERGVKFSLSAELAVILCARHELLPVYEKDTGARNASVAEVIEIK